MVLRKVVKKVLSLVGSWDSKLEYEREYYWAAVMVRYLVECSVC